MSRRSLHLVGALWLAVATEHLQAAHSSDGECLSLLPAQVVATQTLPGGHSRTTAKVLVGRGYHASMQTLLARLQERRRGGHLMRRRAGQWQVFSYWQDHILCIAQIRASDERIDAGFVSRLVLQTSASAASRTVHSPDPDVPAWWPRLEHLHVERWRDAGFRARTVVGLARASVSGLQSRFRQRALDAGYQILGTTPAHPPFSSGSMLMLVQPHRELVLVFTPRGAMTGVVAHLKESVK